MLRSVTNAPGLWRTARLLEDLGFTVKRHVVPAADVPAAGLVGPEWLPAQGLTRPDCAISAGFSYSVVVAHNPEESSETVERDLALADRLQADDQAR